MDAILALNAGSSSIKFAVFEHTKSANAANDFREIARGHVAQAGTEIELRVSDAGGEPLVKAHWHPEHDRFEQGEALDRMFDWLDTHRGGMKVSAVGHRVVHGGAKYTAPAIVTSQVLTELNALVPMAPLHQPGNLKAINMVGERWSEVAQVACFDTAFHVAQPAVAQTIALPRDIRDSGVKRYGFHGLSYEYIADHLPRVLGEHASGKIVVAHLGNGASLCAMVDGKSVATTMGFSVLDGLVMGTRCGTLDAGVVLYLQQQLHMSVQEVSDLLYHRSGLLGVSGISSDMRVLLDSDDSHAAEAIDLFVYRIVGEIGAMAAAMSGIDALVFTAGIGERAAAIRSRICAGCVWLGANIDETANAVDLELIHSPASRLRLIVLPTDEELMIARHTMQTLASQPQ